MSRRVPRTSAETDRPTHSGRVPAALIGHPWIRLVTAPAVSEATSIATLVEGNRAA